MSAEDSTAGGDWLAACLCAAWSRPCDAYKPIFEQLAREFDVTPRTIRFYEDQGLLAPKRTGAGGRQRVYSQRDRTRLKLTLRGKLERKRVDLVCANRVGVGATGFESDDNALLVLGPGGFERALGPAAKTELAGLLLELVAERLA